MNLRNLARLLANQGDLVERLANSSIIRRMAQLTHYSYMKASQSGQKAVDKFADKHQQQQRQKMGEEQSQFMLSRFFKRFYDNVRSEIEKSNRK